MSERANVRPRQRLEGCSARPSSSSARSWDDEDDDESRLSRGNRWKVTLAEKELGASPAAARRFFTVLTETSSRAEPRRSKVFDPISLGHGGVSIAITIASYNGERDLTGFDAGLAANRLSNDYRELIRLRVLDVPHRVFLYLVI